MRKAFKMLLILSIFSFAFVFASCGKSKSTSDSDASNITNTNVKEYTYSFYNEDGIEIIKTDTIKEGNTIIPPLDPEKESTETNSYDFIGWYTQKEGGEKVTSFDNINSNVVLYARFEETRH